MDIFTSIFDFFGLLISYIIPFLFVLSIVVFFHELGHFSVARWFGTKVDTFSIGYGKEIFGWNDKHGTRWKVSWLPLGGYVKFFGDENAASAPDNERIHKLETTLSETERNACFHFKPLHQRAAIVAAGPIANFVLAVVIFAVMFMTVGEYRFSAEVGEVTPDGAAAEAGIQPGDVITRIEGKQMRKFSDLQRIVSTSADSALDVEINRNGETRAFSITPRRTEITDDFGNTYEIGLIGVKPALHNIPESAVRYDPFTAVAMGVGETYFVIERTMVFLGRMFVGKEDARELGGPLRIAQVSGQVATLGIIPLIKLAAFLSVSIGLMNLFPIPLLDGGHLLFYGIEAVKGSPLSEGAQEVGFRVGLALVLCLMIFATWNDVIRLSSF